jgi:hypothetical protein
MITTIYHILGYGADTRAQDLFGRPIDIIRGKPVLRLF